ncbi:hypothetical protein MUDAN_DOGOELCO_01435 [Lactiplantibacillus mudanjiangensis]|nr:hypothetical protein MUDAN_DOGOELCO_01435 [Lactiplantibacillus mudanjiangensis]
MAPAVKISLVWVISPDFTIWTTFETSGFASLKSKVDARILAGAGPHSRQNHWLA